MTIKQYQEFLSEINFNIDEYRKEILTKSKQEIYDSNYKTIAYEEIYDYLVCNAKDMNKKYLPQKNVLDYYYYKFMKTDYNLTNDDLRDFFDYELEEAKKYKIFKNDEEM